MGVRAAAAGGALGWQGSAAASVSSQGATATCSSPDSFRSDALDRLGPTQRETEVLYAAAAIEEEADIAWELCTTRVTARGCGRGG